MVTPPVPGQEPGAEAPAVARPPLPELLPTDALLVVVLAAGLAAVIGSLARYGLDTRGLIGAVFCPVLILLAAIDARHRLLPNTVVLPTALVVAVIVLVGDPGSFPRHLLAAVALGGFFFAFALIFPGSMGMGDAKLGFLLGMALGSRTFAAAIYACAGLLVAALYLLATRGASARRDTIPFGPFLAAGGIVAFFV
ncbi:MAG: leader peptidase (prepilin peptidase) / N-methyltransferase [Gaiellaceae bacterium]|jgi:prepilin signal peptidase PulO-like enzyme (type II secretory pathway)|nr:leader peptidase (prepilin peptidase) / N-methyltransferase [Gaiellaceae bacterium]